MKRTNPAIISKSFLVCGKSSNATAIVIEVWFSNMFELFNLLIEAIYICSERIQESQSR